MDALMCKEAIERFPFGVIFSKTAPANLNHVDYDTDFCYYYFSPGLETRCALRRVQMCDGKTNAKRDFPRDFESYFRDDEEVVKGTAKTFCEPWSPPGVVSPIPFVYTRKTALKSGDALFMLGTFELVGETVLGSSSESTTDSDKTPIIIVPYNGTATLPPMSTYEIPDAWFCDAAQTLPVGVAITELDGSVVFSNSNWPGDVGDDLHTRTLSSFATLYPSEGTSEEILLQTALWSQRSDDNCGRGLYHILTPRPSPDGSSRVLRVHVLRPAMIRYADPYYQDGVLHAREH